jgi:serine/threonine-protein kinase
MRERGSDVRRPTFAVPAATADFGAIRWPAHDFESEWTVLLQRRLRLFAAFLCPLAWALYGLNVVNYFAEGGGGLGFLREEQELLAGCVVATGLLVLLRRGEMPRRGLELLDAGMLYVVFAVLVLDYHDHYEEGGDRAPYYLALFVVLHAVVIPSRVLRTVLVSLPGPLAILGVQLLQARWGRPVPAKEPDWTAAGVHTSRWWATVAWDQIYLATAVAIAALTSQVSFALRRRVHEARQLDRYVIEERIGRGAMGDVFRARHALMRRPVAIKFLHAETAGAQTIGRFEQEVVETCRLTHPNSISIYDYGQTEDGVFYYAMEMLEGADLERIVERTGPMSAPRAIHVLVQACNALQEAHAKGIVHRDLKPGNLVLCERGLELDVLKVVDYGLAKDLAASPPSRTQEGVLVGNALTIAPEVVRGETAGPPADVYGLAAVGCHLLSGKPIFDVTHTTEFLMAHLHREPVHPSSRVAVPADLEAVLLRSLAKEPADRHPGVAALRDALLSCRDAGRWTQADAAHWWSEHADLRSPAADVAARV